MEFRGSTAYDQDEFFSAYIKRRNRENSPNNIIEGPIIEELIGNVKEKTILDLGCGDARFGKELLELGAKKYIGIDGSDQMVNAAKGNLEGRYGTVYHASMEEFKFPKDSFEIVTSRFALHYVSNIERIFQNVFNTLKDHGKFVFSIQHPLTTSSFISKQTGDRRENWVVDDYFKAGERKEPWIDKTVIKYHRTIEQYFTTLRRTGFFINELREGTPNREYFDSEEEFKRRQRIPIVLVFSCSK